MDTIEFLAKIKNGVIEIPPEYKNKFKNNVRVILVSEEKKHQQRNMIDELLVTPIKIKDFLPLKRDDIYARK